MFTYEMLAEQLINLVDIDWSGRDAQRNTCQYGLEILIAFVVNCVILLLIGAVSGKIKEIVIYVFAWGSLRLLAGGRHAKNHLFCIVYFIAVMFLVIYAAGYLVTLEDAKIMIPIFMLIGLAVNGVYAGRNKKNQKKAYKSKKATLIVCGIEYLVICFLVGKYFDRNQILYYLAIFSGAVLAESLFLLPLDES